MQTYDVVIIGGGPAGSTVGTLLKRYAPHLKVLLLEKMHFPRHHVGESLLAGASPILQEMNVYEKVKSYGFMEKVGATYVWGQNRKPWGFTFSEIVNSFMERGEPIPDFYLNAWQVRRAEYDQLLLDHTAECGVEVHQGACVTRVHREPGRQRITGIDYRDERGVHTVASTWLMDCSGQSGFLSREMQLREYDNAMNNYALWGYWKDARWEFEFVGYPGLTRIFVATTPHGWIWYIPVKRDVISVGFVTHHQTLKEMAGKVKQLYLNELQACPEIHGLLDGASLVRIAADQKHDICAIQDWSYESKRMQGAGWALAGDAAGFVDPILSSGVMLAHELSQKAAYTLVSAFSASSDEQVQAYWDFYDQTYHTFLQAYKEMARFWYSNNFSMESWWWQARRFLDQQESITTLTAREAFIRVAFGYATRAESTALFGSYPLNEALTLADQLFGGGTSPAEEWVARFAGRPLRLKEQARMTRGMLYHSGRIRETPRIIGSNNRSLDLRPVEAHLTHLLDGAHTLEDLNCTLRAIDVQDTYARGALDFLIQLDTIGALEYA
ncbi:MAG TPA: NAD(P)/FAD-dependent oxidoreductase [Ktedonobacteraceae bacterium]|nr:NAD(P)/FAD-dependent oxidoreductase [Ktedonobacteraceae bacterium]